MHKTSLLLIFCTLFLSCELTDSGRMAAINFNFTQPDLVKDSLSTQNKDIPDRILPAETSTVVVIMYPSFSDDPLIDSDNIESYVPDFEELDQILTKSDTRTLHINFGSEFSGGSLENIEPGKYSFAVFTFASSISSLTSEDMGSVMTWRIKKNVDIAPGLNLVDLPLKLNSSVYEGVITADIQNEESAEAIATNDETIFISLTNFNAGECQVIYDSSYFFPDTVVVMLYSEDGYLLDADPKVSGSDLYLTFTVPDPTFTLLVSAQKIVDFTGNNLELYTDFSFYDSGPPQSIYLNISTFIDE